MLNERDALDRHGQHKKRSKKQLYDAHSMLNKYDDGVNPD
jgi:hypothetical protein